MHGESNQGRVEGIDAQAEHLVVLLVAGARQGRSRERIHCDLGDIGPERVDAAIASLARIGLVAERGRSVFQSAALARLDWLSMIGV
jgi:hypothetical protein